MVETVLNLSDEVKCRGHNYL